ncbi:hypothetical protein ElyMa_007006700 [Elysia marginata]|uniref:Fibronectin type-III domain-containing protein n=1 Tax=Elysia marginata TaxID=1093978 RepID=A0AAV4JPE5_9GAST|nr:hypothetical protein ElyMa_007006700 [Elysia marginata]
MLLCPIKGEEMKALYFITVEAIGKGDKPVLSSVLTLKTPAPGDIGQPISGAPVLSKCVSTGVRVTNPGAQWLTIEGLDRSSRYQVRAKYFDPIPGVERRIWSLPKTDQESPSTITE